RSAPLSNERAAHHPRRDRDRPAETQPRARVFKNGGRQTDSKHSKLWKTLVREAVLEAQPAAVAPGSALEMELHLGMPVQDKKKHGRPHTGRRDFDNLAEAICDALQDCGAIVDDGRISD